MAGPYVRTFWTVEGKVDKDGHPIEFPTEAAARAQSSAGGIAGTGVSLGPLGAAATPPVKVTESMTEDGEYVQTTEGPDGQPQELTRGVDKARMDLYKTRQEAATRAAPPVESAATAETRRHNQATEAGAANAAARSARTEQRQITAQEAQQRAAALREDRANAIATRRLTMEEADREYDRRYRDEVETPLKLAAEQRAIAAAKRQEEESRLASRREDRLTTAQDRQARTDEERLGLERLKFSSAREDAAYQRGQDAVSNTLKLLPYRVDPSVSPSLAGIYNQIMPGAFQPGAFSFDLPNLDAIAAAHVGPLLAMHNQSVQSAGAPVGQPPPVAGAGPPPGQPPVDPLAGVPVQPLVKPDQWYR